MGTYNSVSLIKGATVELYDLHRRQNGLTRTNSYAAASSGPCRTLSATTWKELFRQATSGLSLIERAPGRCSSASDWISRGQAAHFDVEHKYASVEAVPTGVERSISSIQPPTTSSDISTFSDGATRGIGRLWQFRM